MICSVPNHFLSFSFTHTTSVVLLVATPHKPLRLNTHRLSVINRLTLTGDHPYRQHNTAILNGVEGGRGTAAFEQEMPSILSRDFCIICLCSSARAYTLWEVHRFYRLSAGPPHVNNYQSINQSSMIINGDNINMRHRSTSI